MPSKLAIKLAMRVLLRNRVLQNPREKCPVSMPEDRSFWRQNRWLAFIIFLYLYFVFFVSVRGKEVFCVSSGALFLARPRKGVQRIVMRNNGHQLEVFRANLLSLLLPPKNYKWLSMNSKLLIRSFTEKVAREGMRTDTLARFGCNAQLYSR